MTSPPVREPITEPTHRANDGAPPLPPRASDDVPPLRSPGLPPPAARVTTFLLIRHAESEANAGAYFASQSDAPLSSRGREQVERLAAALSTARVDAVYSSDLSRARDTVAPIAAARGQRVRESARLRERAMGVLTGMSFDEARQRYPELWAQIARRDPHAAPEGGESHAALFARVAGVLGELRDAHRGESVLVGSHGVAIHHMIRFLIGLHDVEAPLWTTVDNASVTRVELHERAQGVVAPRLVYANRVVAVEGEPAF